MNGGSPMASPRVMIAFGGRRSNAPLVREGTAAMKFALHFGNNTFSDPEGARRLARLAEAAGFDSVFAVEHVVWPENTRAFIPMARPAACQAIRRQNCRIR